MLLCEIFSSTGTLNGRLVCAHNVYYVNWFEILSISLFGRLKLFIKSTGRIEHYHMVIWILEGSICPIIQLVHTLVWICCCTVCGMSMVCFWYNYCLLLRTVFLSSFDNLGARRRSSNSFCCFFLTSSPSSSLQLSFSLRQPSFFFRRCSNSARATSSELLLS